MGDGKTKRWTTYLLLSAAALAGGCRRLPPTPEGLPPLYRCEIRATFGGESIEGVQVALESTNPDAKKWRSGGATDSEGVARLRTAFCYRGVPEGEYRISFAKSQERIGDELDEMTPLSLIPLKYGPEQSDAKIVVQPKENVFTFELDGGEEPYPVPKGARPGPKMKR